MFNAFRRKPSLGASALTSHNTSELVSELVNSDAVNVQNYTISVINNPEITKNHYTTYQIISNKL